MTVSRLSRRAFTRGTIRAIAAASLPRSLAAQTTTTSPDPMVAAEEISQLEVISHIPALYTFYELMHPDAQAIVPRHVVIGWYRDVFQASGPEPAISTGVTYKDWTWPVNGVTYPSTAEVSYSQRFANGSVVTDVVRLVQDNGAWKWFFGRDRSWVEEQIRHYTQTMNVPQAGQVPFGLEQVVPHQDMLARLPDQIESMGSIATLELPAAGNLQLPEWAAGMAGFRYVMVPEPYPVGFAQTFQIRPDISVLEAIRIALDGYETSPPFTLHAWNLSPEDEVPFAHFEAFASDAVGHADFVMWGHEAGETLGLISHVEEMALEAMASSLIRRQR